MLAGCCRHGQESECMRPLRSPPLTTPMDPSGSGGAGAGGVPIAAAAAPPAGAGAVVDLVVPVAAAAAAPWPALNFRNNRVKWAKALFVLGCAAAALAFFAMNSPTADSRLLGACEPTDAEAADLRAASEQLLLAASAQVLGATTAVMVPARPVAVFASLLGYLTGYRAIPVLWVLVACHDHVHGVLAINYFLFVAMLCVVFLVGTVVSIMG